MAATLDFPSSPRQSHGVPMIRRLTTLLVTLAYLGVVTWIGLIHHHEESACDSDQCAACIWQIQAVTDTPAVATAVQVHSIETLVASPTTASVPAQFVPTSASRAPPETST
jgi:hypothetical protein